MIHLSNSLNYYKRPEIQQAIVEHAANKEVAARFNDSFGKRPDMLNYPNDVLELAKQGASSFHCSEELWRNPLQLQPLMSRKELDELRTGWDLVIDVDYNDFDYSKFATELIVEVLKHYGIKGISVKFSGNKGFHIAVPYESFPPEYNGTSMKLLFPEATKRIVSYIIEKIKKPLLEKIRDHEPGTSDEKMIIVAKKLGVPRENFSKVDTHMIAGFIHEVFLKIDTGLSSSRHMYRMPYSLHEKSGLVSVPISIDKISDFRKEDASPEKVIPKLKFIDRAVARRHEASRLFRQAFDIGGELKEKEHRNDLWQEASERFRQTSYATFTESVADAIPPQFFPPCINKLLDGVEDGRKRALFILINFLASCGYGYESMEKILKEWNKKNKQPLHETYFLGQLRYHKQQKKKILPPNCSNINYYQDLRVKCPDEFCRFKNPVNYARKRSGK